MFFRQPKPVADITPGAVYRRNRPHNIVEVAEVMRVSDDRAGIPHVHFRVSYGHKYQFRNREVRTLALASFTDRYQPELGQAASLN